MESNQEEERREASGAMSRKCSVCTVKWAFADGKCRDCNKSAAGAAAAPPVSLANQANMLTIAGVPLRVISSSWSHGIGACVGQ